VLSILACKRIRFGGGRPEDGSKGILKYQLKVCGFEQISVGKMRKGSGP